MPSVYSSQRRLKLLPKSGRGHSPKLAQEGRDPYSVKIYALLSIVTDETDAKAQAKFKKNIKAMEATMAL